VSRRIGGTWLGLVLAGSLVACGGSDTPVGERAVTSEEAARMAEALFTNYDVGGADFELNGQMTDGSRAFMTGTIDWKTHSGHAQVQLSEPPDAAVTEVYWTADAVLERVPALSALAAQLGQRAAEFYVRAPDVEGRNLDSLIQLITSLGAEQRDNAVLISQQPGTAWLRSDTMPSTDAPVDVLRYGDRTTYWLEAGGVTLLRFEGNNSDGTRPVLVDLRGHGPRTIEFPPAADVAETSQLLELYEAATSG
jgi:hypothetical protein